MTEPVLDDAALRADIRRVVGLLGESLVRQEGQAFFDLLEEVRAGSRTDPAATAARLDDLEVASAGRLVRAFLAYFHLANVTEQVHHGRAYHSARRDGGWLVRAAASIEAAGIGRDELTGLATRLAVCPVFTAHPTEAAPRTTLARLRAVATLLEDEHRAQAADGRVDAWTEARLAEVVELLWLTDDLRIVRPEPLDEARNAIWYFDELYRHAVPRVLDELQATLSRLGMELAPTARPLAFGTWIGGDRDGNPNVTAEVTLDVIRLQHDHAIRDALVLVDDLRQDLAVSTRLVEVSDTLVHSLEADLAALPEVEDRYLRLNAEEPYRLKATCIRQKLVNTQARIRDRAAHQPGHDYLGTAQVVADLLVMRESLLANRASWSAGAGSTRPSGRSSPSGCSSRPWTCASTPTPTTAPSAPSSSGSASPTPASLPTSGGPCSAGSWPTRGRSLPGRHRSPRPASTPTASSPPSARRRRSSVPRRCRPTSCP